MSAAPTATVAPTDGADPRLTSAQVAIVCSEIASLAFRLDREFFHGNDSADLVSEGEIPERTALFLDRLRDAIAHIGWLADIGAAHDHVMEDPRKWLLPPIFFLYANTVADVDGGAP